MRHTLSGREERMLIKLVVDAASRIVVGAHILGPDAGEMAQILGIAVKASPFLTIQKSSASERSRTAALRRSVALG